MTEPLAAAISAADDSTQVEIVRRAARGDRGAFEELVVSGAERAYRVARAILGNDSDAHDATQEAFVSAWRELPRLRNPRLFDAWLRRILVNACRETIRSRGRVREISLDEQPIDRAATGPGVADHVGDSELLSRAFDRLDAGKRSILVLHYLEHAPVATIATALGIPTGTAKWRLSDARDALARALAAEGEARR